MGFLKKVAKVAERLVLADADRGVKSVEDALKKAPDDKGDKPNGDSK